jgi:hypothetical protein
MFSKEIQLDTHGGPVTLAPRWLRVPGAVKYSGLSRSKLYELLSDGRIRSICVRSQKGAQRGVRLIDRESIDSFISDPSEPANTRGVSVAEQNDSGSLCHGSNPCEAGCSGRGTYGRNHFGLLSRLLTPCPFLRFKMLQCTTALFLDLVL